MIARAVFFLAVVGAIVFFVGGSSIPGWLLIATLVAAVPALVTLGVQRYQTERRLENAIRRALTRR